ARASLPVYGGIRETDDPGEASKWSLRPPFMNRLYPAETRLKEGADAHDSDRTGGNCSLAAGWWRPVSALPAVSRDCRFDVKCESRSNGPACWSVGAPITTGVPLANQVRSAMTGSTRIARRAGR